MQKLKEIPVVEFSAEVKKYFSFDIVPIKEIRDNRKKYKPDLELLHKLSFFNLMYVTNGTGQHYVDFDWYPIKENSLVFMSKEQLNAFDFSTDFNGFCLLFTEDFFIEIFSKVSKAFVFRLFNPQLFSPVVQVPSNADVLDYIKLFKKEYDKGCILNQKAVLNSLFTILLSKIEQNTSNEHKVLNNTGKSVLFQKFITLVEANYMQQKQALFYANKLAISYKYLNEVCKETVGKTAKTVIDNFIVLQAKRNLANSNIKSSELSYKLGFDDPTNFTKYFKKHTGLTPKAFKLSVLNN